MLITDKSKHGLLFFALLTGGCATMSAEDCSTADWRLIGLADGSQQMVFIKLGVTFYCLVLNTLGDFANRDHADKQILI